MCLDGTVYLYLCASVGNKFNNLTAAWMYIPWVYCTYILSWSTLQHHRLSHALVCPYSTVASSVVGVNVPSEMSVSPTSQAAATGGKCVCVCVCVCVCA